MRYGTAERGGRGGRSGRAGEDAISGVYPMLFAFFDGAEQLDRGAMRRQVDALVGAGVHGIAALGLATECNKLSVTEKRRLLDWVAEDLNGRLPLSVTVSEPDVAGQIAFVQAAAAAGAGWVVLQPPPVKGAPESELLRFFGAVADASPIPVGLQIAPEYLGIGLRSEEHTSELQSLMRISYAVFCLKKKKK